MELYSIDNINKDKSMCLLVIKISATAWLPAWAGAFPYCIHMGDRALATNQEQAVECDQSPKKVSSTFG